MKSQCCQPGVLVQWGHERVALVVGRLDSKAVLWTCGTVRINDRKTKMLLRQTVPVSTLKVMQSSDEDIEAFLNSLWCSKTGVLDGITMLASMQPRIFKEAVRRLESVRRRLKA